MKIIKENYKKDVRLGFYWGRIYFISDNRARKARVLWAFTESFAQKKLVRESLDKNDIDKIINAIVNKWKETQNSIFFPAFHYDAFTDNHEEKERLLEFLRSNDKV